MTTATTTVDGSNLADGATAGLVTGPSTATRRLILVAVVMAVCGIYVASSLTYGRSLRSLDQPSGFHALTAAALLDGKVSVLPTPDGLLELDDPYDPVQNAPFRSGGYHDLALYDGRIYTQTGIAPAILIYVPADVLGLGYVSPYLATLLCCIGGFVASVGVLGELRRRFFNSLPIWVEASSAVVVGLATPVPWLVSIGRAYETSIACGYLLVSAGLWALLRAGRQPERPIRWLLGVGSGALALAVGARPHLIAASALIAVAATLIVRSRRRPESELRWASCLAALVIPYVVVGTLLGLYNAARFGAITEFGVRYQLAGYNMQTYPLYDPSHVPPSLVDYLLLRPHTSGRWPYITLSPSTFIPDPSVHTHEPIAGVLTLFPVLPLGVLFGLLAWRSSWRERRALAWLLIGLVGFACVMLIAIVLPFNASTMRYTVDFAPSLALASCVGFWTLRAGLQGPRRALVDSCWLGVATLSALIGVALVLTPCPGTGSC